MREIAKNFKGNYREIILGPVFKLAEAVLELFVPLLTASIIDVGVAGGDNIFVLQRGGLMLLLAVLGAAAALTCQYYAAVAGAGFGRRLRRQVFSHVLRLSPGDIEEYGAGGLATRVTNDVNQIQAALNMIIRLATRVPFVALGSIVMALLLNVQAGLIFLAATVLIAGVLVFVMKKTLPRYEDIQAGQDELFRLSAENLEGVRVIRAFSRQKSQREEYDAAAGQLTKLLVRTGKLSALLSPAASVAANLAIVLVVWLGAGGVNRGTMQTGEIIALVNYMSQVLLALLVTANLTVLFTRGAASTRRVEALLEKPPSVTDGPGAAPVAGAPAITFQNVSFRYFEGAENALSDLTFRVERGQTVGVIGGTGSGKSTLVKLLLRQFDPTAGTIELEGAKLRAYTLQELRGKLGVVPQKALLFSGTVEENLRVSDPGAGEEALWQALETAQAADFVRRREGGLQAKIGEGGAGLSGGQRQRLTIARALVRKPDILILDDAASALDYRTEAALRRALRDFGREKPFTTLIISQRVASLRGADSILVLDNGGLVAAGRHEELLTESELYREICESQGLGPSAAEGGRAE